jgi:penicillin-binding protein 1C
VGVWVGMQLERDDQQPVTSAAPILFDVFNLLPRKKWFATPYKDLKVEVCSLSGYLAQENCPKSISWFP